jgi:hypothetical protein
MPRPQTLAAQTVAAVRLSSAAGPASDEPESYASAPSSCPRSARSVRVRSEHARGRPCCPDRTPALIPQLAAIQRSIGHRCPITAVGQPLLQLSGASTRPCVGHPLDGARAGARSLRRGVGTGWRRASAGARGPPRRALRRRSQNRGSAAAMGQEVAASAWRRKSTVRRVELNLRILGSSIESRLCIEKRGRSMRIRLSRFALRPCADAHCCVMPSSSLRLHHFELAVPGSSRRASSSR